MLGTLTVQFIIYHYGLKRVALKLS